MQFSLIFMFSFNLQFASFDKNTVKSVNWLLVDGSIKLDAFFEFRLFIFVSICSFFFDDYQHWTMIFNQTYVAHHNDLIDFRHNIILISKFIIYCLLLCLKISVICSHLWWNLSTCTHNSTNLFNFHISEFSFLI